MIEYNSNADGVRSVAGQITAAQFGNNGQTSTIATGLPLALTFYINNYNAIQFNNLTLTLYAGASFQSYLIQCNGAQTAGNGIVIPYTFNNQDLSPGSMFLSWLGVNGTAISFKYRLYFFNLAL